MAGPTSPGTQGPSIAPPSLPPGWIAQWDGSSQKYYYVQLATGSSQWEVPTEAAKTGTTPAQPADHPYGAPAPELITHPDGSQTVKHSDGTLEPIMPDGSRGMDGDGPSGDRGIGTQAMNALLGGKSGSSPLGQLASQFLGGGKNNHGGGGGGSSGGNGMGGKLASQLASNLFSPSQKPDAPSNYHGNQSSGKPTESGGMAGALMGQMASMFGGKEHASSGNFGYSNSGTGSGYSGEAPTYDPLATPHGGSSSHQNQSQSQGHSQSHASYGQQPQQHGGEQGGQQHGVQQHGGQQHGQQYGGGEQYGQQHGGQHGQQHGGGDQYGQQQQQHGGYNNYQQQQQQPQYGGGQNYGGGGGPPQYQGQNQSYGGNRY